MPWTFLTPEEAREELERRGIHPENVLTFSHVPADVFRRALRPSGATSPAASPETSDAPAPTEHDPGAE